MIDMEEAKKYEIIRKKEEQAKYREMLDFQQREKGGKKSLMEPSNKQDVIF